MATIATKEDKMARLVEIEATVTDMVEQYNEKNQGGEVEEAAKLDTQMRELVNEYTAIARAVCFSECAEADVPVLEAARRLSFATISVSDKKEKDIAADGTEIKLPVRSMGKTMKGIDILKLDKAIKGGIGQDEHWNDMLERFNFELTCQKAKDLGATAKELRAINGSYLMGEYASQMDMGKNPTSRSNILNSLNAVIKALAGDGYEASDKDVEYLLDVYTKKDAKSFKEYKEGTEKRIKVMCANHNFLRAYILDILHRIVCDEKSYGTTFKTKK